MLWTDSHLLANLLHVVEQVPIKHFCRSFRLRQQACKHRDCRRLPSTVMTEQGKYLVVVHLQIDSIYSLKAVRILLLQSLDLEEGVEPCDLISSYLVILLLQELRLEIFIFSR